MQGQELQKTSFSNELLQSPNRPVQCELIATWSNTRQKAESNLLTFHDARFYTPLSREIFRFEQFELSTFFSFFELFNFLSKWMFYYSCTWVALFDRFHFHRQHAIFNISPLPAKTRIEILGNPKSFLLYQWFNFRKFLIFRNKKFRISQKADP